MFVHNFPALGNFVFLPTPPPSFSIAAAPLYTTDGEFLTLFSRPLNPHSSHMHAAVLELVLSGFSFLTPDDRRLRNAHR